jgi:biopolymer transport protein ExbD
MKKKTKLKFGSKRPSADISLNITAMADIFMVLLVFLLKSYASGAMTIMPTAGNLNLPSASTKSEHVEALKIEISQSDLVVEGKQVVPLADFQFPQNDINKSGFSNKLFESIQQIKKSEVLPTTNVIILADRKVPYSALKIIMASAAGAGLTNFKMAVRSLDD